jgi:hypothetical protein
MKRSLFMLLIAYSTCTCLAAQPENPGGPVNKSTFSPEQFMLKSKKQRTAARILLFGGIGVSLAGFIALANEYDDMWVSAFGGDAKYNTTAGEILFWTGFASVTGSIPLFIAAGKNRRNAYSTKVSVDIKKRAQVQYGSVKAVSYPALSITFSL